MDALTDDDFRGFAELAAAAGRAMAPAVVEMDGTEYAATVPAPRRNSDLIDGGTLDKSELRVRILTADHPERPADNVRLRWKRAAGDAWSAWFIADDISDSPIDAEWHIRAIPAN